MSNKNKKPIIAKVLGEIELNAAKAYPIKIFSDFGDIRFAYADKSNKENCNLKVLSFPAGCKTARHFQVAFRIVGDYHIEHPSYYSSNLFKWESWMEIVLPVREVPKLIKFLAVALEEEGLKIRGATY